MVPTGYTSGSALSGSATFDSTTLSAMGLTSGTYTASWGSGATADSVTLEVGSAVPEPATFALLLLPLTALGLARRRG